ncbi:DNA-directed RNA polymerase subunit N [Clostridium perfringens]|uniref:DNA-directed RNA polymerase subunit N n=1 Tax=Clostridium perfringens TaxID=1502 RepID=UPI000D521359|nr:DNA-directed RNA polymerase subunit N [Clostridium perfringens]PVE15293.1 DNA-directed RNA polymerase subunit N [Clostridium perfringens]
MAKVIKRKRNKKDIDLFEEYIREFHYIKNKKDEAKPPYLRYKNIYTAVFYAEMYFLENKSKKGYLKEYIRDILIPYYKEIESEINLNICYELLELENDREIINLCKEKKFKF